MHRRIENEVAFQAARACLGVVANALRPEEHPDAFAEFYQVMKSALHAYQEEMKRLNARLYGAAVQREAGGN